MKTIKLNGINIKTESDFHKEISLALNFGPYYGNNLDALWDRLNYDVERPILIVWENAENSQKQLGSLFDKIISIFNLVKKNDIESELSERFDFIVR